MDLTVACEVMEENSVGLTKRALVRARSFDGLEETVRDVEEVGKKFFRFQEDIVLWEQEFYIGIRGSDAAKSRMVK